MHCKFMNGKVPLREPWIIFIFLISFVIYLKNPKIYNCNKIKIVKTKMDYFLVQNISRTTC